EPVISVKPAPGNHLITAPDRHRAVTRRGRARGGHGRPAVSHWIVKRAIVEDRGQIGAGPNNHARASPDGTMRQASRGRACSGSRLPAVGLRIITAASVKHSQTHIVITAPDEHLAASPNCGMKLAT